MSEVKCFYIKANGEVEKYWATTPLGAKSQYRKKHGLKKLPMGTVVTSNKDSDFLK